MLSGAFEPASLLLLPVPRTRIRNQDKYYPARQRIGQNLSGKIEFPAIFTTDHDTR
jgi:hypothetical protein